MSDHIGHLGVCDDTLRLAGVYPGMEPALLEAAAAHRDIAHMGSVTRGADHWTLELIAWAGDQWKLPADRRDPLVGQKLAFVIGALTHRAADRLTKPITNCFPRGAARHGPDDQANESKIMQDLMVYREVFGSGTGAAADPFVPGVLGAPDAPAFERVFRLMLRRALIAMHTIAADGAHVQDWLTAFLKQLQTFPKSLEQYADLAARWDDAKVMKYLTTKNFYQRQDPMIVLARTIQAGQPVEATAAVVAHRALDRTHSRYARALGKALDYLLAAGDFFLGRIGRDEASKRFDIGMPELSMVE